MKEIWKRICANTPSFFKRVAMLGVGIAGTGGAIIVIPNIPPKLEAIATNMIWIGATMASVSKLTVSNSEDIK